MKYPFLRFRRTKFTWLFFCQLLLSTSLFSQQVTIGSPLDEALRSWQLMGKLDSTVSFTVRPLTGSKSYTLPEIYSLVDQEGKQAYQQPFHFLGKFGKAGLLPLSFMAQYNSHHPYGWNDGAMIAAKGYQQMVSAGFYAALGPLEVQLQPEIVYAANPAYETNNAYGSNTNASYKKVLPGQSSIRLAAGPFAVGVSTENLWWGPGRNSSLLMSNNAPGFLHAFFKTRRPLQTPIGAFEWEIIGGKLLSDDNMPYENFHLKKENLLQDWRYLNALVISYHPKWVPGLFLGFTRGMQRFSADLDIPPNGLLDKYLPIIVVPFQKKNTRNDDAKRTDQLASFFLRWLLTKAKAEIYLEYGFNDYGVNIRDYLMAPTHSAAYLAGFKKIVTLPQKNTRLEVGFELTQMSQSPDYIIRNAGNWYEHGQIRQGYTNNNQILGAGAGFGANVQTFTTTWIKGWKQLGVIFERVERDPLNHPNNWIDMSMGLMPQYKFKNMVLAGKCQFINSSNYGWDKDVNRFNLHATLLVQYLL